jgi:hypothetical protein
VTQITVNGNTYSDDGTAARDMTQGGHRQWLLPMIGDVIVGAQATIVTAAAGFTATSTSSETLDTGSKSLTVQAGKGFVADMFVIVWDAADVSRFMVGQVTAYNSGTGVLAFTVLGAVDVQGTGTITSWRVALTGRRGAQGPIGLTGDTGPVGPQGDAGVVTAAGDGTVGAPGIAYAADTDTGFRRSGSGTQRVVSDGADALELLPATEAEAQAGADALRVMTPQRTAQAISARVATTANLRAGAADKLADAAGLVSAASPVALTDGATIDSDFNAGRVFAVTLGGNRTLANPSNQAAGQSGIIIVKQDATGSRTLSYGTNYKFAGGAPTLSTAASAIDVISYYVEASGTILCTYSGEFA